jgi:hypothetical protein
VQREGDGIRRNCNRSLRLTAQIVEGSGGPETRLTPVFEAAGNPWVQPQRGVRGKSVDQRMVEFHQQGLSPYKIAARLGVSHMTVRRRLGRLLVPSR